MSRISLLYKQLIIPYIFSFFQALMTPQCHNATQQHISFMSSERLDRREHLFAAYAIIRHSLIHHQLVWLGYPKDHILWDPLQYIYGWLASCQFRDDGHRSLARAKLIKGHTEMASLEVVRLELSSSLFVQRIRCAGANMKQAPSSWNDSFNLSKGY